MLGFNILNNMTPATVMSKSVSGVATFRSLPVAEFRGHSISVGASAKLLAQINIPVLERGEKR